MVMLKNIPKILSPEILSVLARMGHGDQIVLADANFPSSSVSKAGPELVRADGHGCTAVLKGVLALLPIDTYTDAPVMLMEPTSADKARGIETPIWDEYKSAVNNSEGREVNVGLIERFEFYKHSEKAFAIVATGESALYGNIILTKGVL